MNFFALRRHDALAALKVAETSFPPLDDLEPAPPPLEDEPQEETPVSAANALVTALLALDIAEAVRADHPEPALDDCPARLSQRHLETVERLVTHLKGEELRLREQIAEARHRLADTRLARSGFERNSVVLRRGIAALTRDPDAEAAPRPPQRRLRVARDPVQPAQLTEVGAIGDAARAVLDTERRKAH